MSPRFRLPFGKGQCPTKNLTNEKPVRFPKKVNLYTFPLLDIAPHKRGRQALPREMEFLFH